MEEDIRYFFADLILDCRQLHIRGGLVQRVRQLNCKLHYTRKLVPHRDKTVNSARDNLVVRTINHEDIAPVADSAFRCDLKIVVFVRFRV